MENRTNNEQFTDSHETPTVLPRIYVASLADYTNGRLHGEWIDPTQELDDLYAAVTQMLGTSKEAGAEEFAIHDYEGFYDFRIGEYESLEVVHQIACGIAEHGEAYAAYVELVGTDQASLDGFADAHFGSYRDTDEFIDSYLDACGWDDEIDRLRDKTPLGTFITLNRDDLLTALESSLSVVEGQAGVYVFYP